MPKTSSERPQGRAAPSPSPEGIKSSWGGPATTCEPYRRVHLHGPTMGTRWSVRCDIGAGLDVAALRDELAAAVEQVDQQMSPWKPDSDLNRLNAAAPEQWVALPRQTVEVLTRALQIARASGGAFDPAVGALVGGYMVLVKSHNREVPIPFGPYLAGGGLAALFFGQLLLALMLPTLLPQ